MADYLGRIFPAEQRDPIRRVKVRGLFQTYDHIITFSEDSNLTVVFGPNGVGKTILLRMLNELFNGGFDVLATIPFDSLVVEFCSGDKIRVWPGQRTVNGRAEVLRYVAELPSLGQELESKTGEYAGDFSRELLRALGPTWEYDEERYIDREDGETLTAAEATRRVERQQPWRGRKPLTPDATLQRVHAKCRTRLIGTDRLLGSIDLERGTRHTHFYDSAGATRQRNRAKPEARIVQYGRDLKMRLDAVRSAYAQLAVQLDQTLIDRLLTWERDPNVGPLQVLAAMDDIERWQDELQWLGISKRDKKPKPVTDQVLALIEESLSVFCLHVEDMKTKLAVFDRIRSQIRIFLERTSETLQCKKLVLDPIEGVAVMTDRDQRISITGLSSGEQQEIILLYEMLFFSDDVDLILIDEPELSLHIEWQSKLLRDFQEALRGASTQVLLATHSPAVAAGVRSGLVSLRGQRF